MRANRYSRAVYYVFFPAVALIICVPAVYFASGRSRRDVVPCWFIRTLTETVTTSKLSKYS